MIDSHCHIDFSEFDSDRQAILDASFRKGVRALIIPSVEPNCFVNLRALSRSCLQADGANDNASRIDRGIQLYYCAGLHPWWVSQYIQSFSKGRDFENSVLENNDFTDKLYLQLSEELSRPHCVALGESGLHLTNNFYSQKNELASQKQQLESLDVHFELANKKSKPLVLHNVKAHQLLLARMKKHTVRGVVHAFSGSYEQAKAFWDQGFYLGVGGVISYERAKKTRRAIQRMPLDSLLLETDAPDMPLVGRQGQRNSPEYLNNVCQVLADLKGVSFEEVQAHTMKNTQLLFDLDS